MYNRLLPKQLFCRTSFALTTLLLAPALATAQPPTPATTTETEAARMQRYQEVQKKMAAIQEQYEKTHKAVVVTVDYVDVSLAELLKASQWIASGQEHDAQLLAALVKNGAQDTKGTQIKAWDKMSVGRGKTVSVIVPGNVQPQSMNSYTEATPQFNADGTITILIRLELGKVRGIPLPSSEPGYQCAFPTFHDGQTIKIGEGVMHSASGASLAHLTFVRAATSTSDSEEDEEPAINKPSGNSIVVTP